MIAYNSVSSEACDAINSVLGHHRRSNAVFYLHFACSFRDLAGSMHVVGLLSRITPDALNTISAVELSNAWIAARSTSIHP